MFRKALNNGGVGYDIEHAEGAENDWILFKSMSVASLQKRPIKFPSFATNSAVYDGIYPDTVVRFFCGALLNYHWCDYGCPYMSPFMMTSIQEVVETVTGDCGHCSRVIRLDDEYGFLLQKLISLARCASTLVLFLHGLIGCCKTH